MPLYPKARLQKISDARKWQVKKENDERGKKEKKKKKEG